MENKLKNVPKMSWTNFGIVVISLAAIILHFFLVYLGYGEPQSIMPLIIIIILAGIPLAVIIVKNLLSGDLGADLIAVIALLCASALDQYLAAVLIIIMLAGGQALENYAIRKASSVLLALAARIPSKAHRKIGDDIEEINIEDIKIADLIVVYPHETCAVDGVVVEGHSSMDESYLTGEPYLLPKTIGANVLSGAINGESMIIIRTEQLPSESRYAKIMSVMEDAEQKRPKLRRLGDKIGAIFAPIALIFALVAWYISDDAMRFLAVLVVATPCPLLIAIPITIISAISKAAKSSIIIKDPTILETLPTCKTAIFDKTGTLTYGKPELLEILVAEEIKQNEILAEIASIERYSKHPLANAILEEARRLALELLVVEYVAEKPGEGLVGKVNDHVIEITNRNKLLTLNPQLGSSLPPIKPGLECVVMREGKFAALLYFRDAPRKDGKLFVSHLKPYHQFQKIMLVSGDREVEVKYLAEKIGIQEVLFMQSPEQKLDIVRQEVKKAPTLFMGDGINDAPALAAATVGIAFGQGDVTAQTAGVVIMDSKLSKVDELIHISRSMRVVALQSAIGGIALSFIAMGFAAAGYISPVRGALLQEAIDIITILNALRFSWKKVKIDL